jgi:integrase/recombinase XerD
VIPRFLENQATVRAHNSWTPESSVRIAHLLEGLPVEEAAIVAEFMSQLHLLGLSTNSLGSYADAISSIAKIGKPFDQLTKNDLIQWVKNLESTCSPSTINLRKILVKRFLRWVHTSELKGSDYPEVVEWLKPKIQRRCFPKRILSEVEVKNLVDVCKTQRDRALVLVSYESGARPGELLTLKVGDVEFDKYGATARLDGKTGERRIRLVQSVPDLKLWLSMHPKGNDRKAPLWPTERDPDLPVGLRRWQDLLESLVIRAGINKQVNPHLLRHTRATHLANVLTEAQMREFFGWTKISEMPSIYVHLSGRDIDGAILKHYGIKVEEDKQALTALAPKRCPRCMNQNPPSARFCMDCHSPLEITAVSEAEQISEQDNSLTALFVKSVLKHVPTESLEKILGEEGLKEKILELGKKSEGSGSNS